MSGCLQLPTELLCICLKLLPDTNSLRNAILAHSSFYGAFAANKKGITASVLRNEIPTEIYDHALANFIVNSRSYSSPIFESIRNLNKVSTCVEQLRHECDMASKRDVSLGEALLISQTNENVTQLCGLILGNGAHREKHSLFPLWNAIHFPKPSHSERTRVYQAIYLFNILSTFCRSFDITVESDRRNIEEFRRHLQQCIVERLMAPWEFYHVIGIRAYLRRAFQAYEESNNSKLIAYILSSGLDLIHRSLCITGPSRLEEVLGIEEQTTSYEHGSAFDFVVAQSLTNSWLRRCKKPIMYYKPFWNGDQHSHDNWEAFENRHFAILGTNSETEDIIRHETTLLDGFFGLWGTALWDEGRWKETIQVIVDLDLISVLEMPDDWDPMAIGILLIDDAVVLNR